MDGQSVKSRSGQRSKGRRFHGNRFTDKNIPRAAAVVSTISDIPHATSASKRKLSDLKNRIEQKLPSKNPPANRIVDISILFKELVKSVCCIKCHSKLSIQEISSYGLSSKFEIKCGSCENESTFRSSKMLGICKNRPDVNRRMVLAMRMIGKSSSSIEKFCTIMCLPSPVTQKAYDQINLRILHATSNVATSVMKEAACKESSLTDSMDITVSGDGTWKTRGHSSLVGVCTLIGAESGKVVDLEVLSSFCKGCDSYKGTKFGPVYKKWKKRHVKFCQQNHNGSAGQMEVSGMVKIFRRSEKERGVRYTSYIGDGDSKTFQTVVDSQPYGKDAKLEKIECVGHIQKRMGTRLRNLKKNMQRKKLSDGKTIGGKGRLTDSLIKKLTIYYGNAIRANKSSVYDMRKSIWAIWMHIVSTDQDPQHHFCPKGPDTWCRYNQSVEKKTHENFVHPHPVPKAVMEAIKPIFKDLSSPILLKRCLGGRTQNANESLNSLIWSICPKTTNSSKRIAEIAANTACILFNEGNKGILNIMNELELEFGEEQNDAVLRKDETRVKSSIKRASSATHHSRKAKIMQKIAKDDLILKKEGVMYASGAF